MKTIRLIMIMVVAAMGVTTALQAQQAAVDIPWNDKIPAGTPAHATRQLAESPRHGE